MIEITQGMFLDRTGIDLTEAMRGYGVDASKQADIILNRWEKRIYKEAVNYGQPIRDNELTELQKDTLIDVVCEYGNYSFHKGDYFANGGIDEDGKEIKDLLPKLMQDLKDVGIFRVNLKGR